MKKKEYQKPSTTPHLLKPMSMIADSGDTGASGGDVPWGVKQRASFDDEEYDY